MKLKNLMLKQRLPVVVAVAVASVAVMLAGCGGGGGADHQDDDSSPPATVCGVRGELLPGLFHQRQQGGPEVAAVLACPARVDVPDQPDRRGFVVMFMDAADDADYMEALQYRYSYTLDSRGVMLSTDEPSPTQARLILVDVLGTDRIEELRVLR